MTKRESICLKTGHLLFKLYKNRSESGPELLILTLFSYLLLLKNKKAGIGTACLLSLSLISLIGILPFRTGASTGVHNFKKYSNFPAFFPFHRKRQSSLLFFGSIVKGFPRQPGPRSTILMVRDPTMIHSGLSRAGPNKLSRFFWQGLSLARCDNK